MTLSRRAPAFWLACAAAPAGAQLPIDYRLPPATAPLVRTDLRPDCPTSSSGDDIVVCGRREDERFRVGPSDPVPGARRRLIAGEPPGAVPTLPGDDRRCSTIGPNPSCNGGLDVLGIAFGIVRLIARARANRD